MDTERGKENPLNQRGQKTMKKTIEMLKNEKYYAPLYIIIEDEIENIRKAEGWRKVTNERYEEAMNRIAEAWNVDADELREYYGD